MSVVSGGTTAGIATAGIATGTTSGNGGVSSTGSATSKGGASSTGGTSSTGGPAMVKLPERYCIDSTEVTRDQYAASLATTTNAAIHGQKITGYYPAYNATFTPDAKCLENGADWSSRLHRILRLHRRH